MPTQTDHSLKTTDPTIADHVVDLFDFVFMPTAVGKGRLGRPAASAVESHPAQCLLIVSAAARYADSVESFVAMLEQDAGLWERCRDAFAGRYGIELGLTPPTAEAVHAYRDTICADISALGGLLEALTASGIAQAQAIGHLTGEWGDDSLDPRGAIKVAAETYATKPSGGPVTMASITTSTPAGQVYLLADSAPGVPSPLAQVMVLRLWETLGPAFASVWHDTVFASTEAGALTIMEGLQVVGWHSKPVSPAEFEAFTATPDDLTERAISGLKFTGLLIGIAINSLTWSGHLASQSDNES